MRILLVFFSAKSANSTLFGILRIPPFVNHKGKDVNSDWLAGQWDERSVLGHARINKGRMKGDDPGIHNAQTPKRFDRNPAPQEKIRKTFADSIPNNTVFRIPINVPSKVISSVESLREVELELMSQSNAKNRHMG